jgi:hypothetical protein
MVTLERDVRRTGYQIPLRITQAMTEMGGGGDLGGNLKGGEITRQRRARQKDSRAKEVMSKRRVRAPRKGEHHAGTKMLHGI